MVATAIEKEKYPACVLDIKNNEGSGAKIKQFLQKQEQYGYEYAVSELEKQREILFKHCLKPTGTDGFGWEDTPKPVYNKRQEVAQDALNGIANDTSEITEFDSERMALLNW
jgi:hypothetical protein